MSQAWDPVTGRPIDASDLLRAAGAHDTLPLLPDSISEVLTVKLLDADGSTVGSFFSKEAGAAADRLCLFLSSAGNATVHLEFGKHRAICAVVPESDSVQTSILLANATPAPAVILYHKGHVKEWAERVCRAFLASPYAFC